jgi:ferredoxin-NADP reductase
MDRCVIMPNVTSDFTGSESRKGWLSDLTRARRPINGLLRTRLVAGLTSPRNIDDYLRLVDPAWSVKEVRACLADVRSETEEATSLFLKPNENWRGFRPGQFVQLSVAIDGVRHTRCFSLSSAPEDGQPLRMTIKSVAGGRVSGWARTRARVGDVVELSQALGDFALPDPVPRRLLFVSGGSGITPILSIVRHLAATRYDGAVGWIHYARREMLFEEEVNRLASRFRGLRLAKVRTRPTDASVGAGPRFSVEALEAFDAAWAACEAFVCGPALLNQAAASIWATHGLAHRLHIEHFATSATAPASSLANPKCRLVFARSRREVVGRAEVSLLEHAEAAGLKPAYGCRMGICRTCTCRKLSGTVRNQLTGESSSEADEEIRLCISTPLSDVTLDL